MEAPIFTRQTTVSSALDDLPDASDRIIVDPPCGITEAVEFENGRCPISEKKSCDDCICTEQDYFWITVLKDDTIPQC